MQLVTFDLNGTLLRGSVFRYVANQLGRGERVEETTRGHKAGEITKEEAYRRNHALFEGESARRVHGILEQAPWIEGIGETLTRLRGEGIDVWLVTDQPDWALAPLSRWDLTTGVYTSTRSTETIGPIHELVLDKWSPLEHSLQRAGIPPEEVCHVGDWENDLPVFENVGASIGLNPAIKAVEEAADTVVRGNALPQVLDPLDLR